MGRPIIHHMYWEVYSAMEESRILHNSSFALVISIVLFTFGYD